MTDRLDSAARSRLMSKVRAKDTRPELIVRRTAHHLGYRFRLHRRDLPGTPDLVFPRHRAAIFVHGCFWHGHGCSKGRLPKSRLDYWAPKIEANRKRDDTTLARLQGAGWRVLTIWQCETSDREALAARIASFLEGGETDRQRV